MLDMFDIVKLDIFLRIRYFYFVKSICCLWQRDFLEKIKKDRYQTVLNVYKSLKSAEYLTKICADST